MKRQVRISLKNILFFSALSIYMVRLMLDTSLYDYILPGGWTRLVNGAVLALLVLKWLTGEEYTIKKLAVWACVFLLMFVVAIANNYLNLFVVIALVFSAQDIEFDDILKCILLCLCILTLFVIGSCGLGILEDYVYPHHIVSFIDTGHSLGFKYYSTPGYIAMALTAMYLYLDRHCGYIRLILLTAANILFYLIHTTALAIAVSLIMIAAYVVTVKWSWFKFQKKIWDYLAILAPLGFFSGTVLLVLLYAGDGFSINIPILSTIASRLEYSIEALEEYGLHLFGTRVTMYGNTALFYGEADSGFYIDSGYIYMLIAYGILVSIVVIICYMILSHYVYMQHDAYGYAWLIVILAICSINNFVFSVDYNPLLFLLPKALFDVYSKEKQYLVYPFYKRSVRREEESLQM